jgi:hypothetical protein
MLDYIIPLYSGIGNIIQSIPFANHMKKIYGKISAIPYYCDYRETMQIVENVFDQIYISKDQIQNGSKVASIPTRRSFNEYKAWFVDNNEDVPKEFITENIEYESLIDRHQIVLWPECKPNWPCKRWPYFQELASNFDDVAIIGTEQTEKFENVTDYRGKLSLLETGGILKNTNIFIGNEGGMAHYAAALGTKTYIIMGATDPVKCLPPNNVTSISLDLDCQPCQFRNMMVTETTAIGCLERPCLNNLTVEKVLKCI